MTIILYACDAPTEVEPTVTAEVIAVATATLTATPTVIPTNTTTPTPSATPLPSPTATNTPTETPSPTATIVPPEFGQLVLALDYDEALQEPLSPRDYFPLGVSYIAAVFDYDVHQFTRLDWAIIGENENVEANGIASLTAGSGTKAIIAHPEMGLDEGRYEFSFKLDNKTVFSSQFDVFWNPTVWPITIGANPAGAGQVANAANQFPAGTESVFASYPTINFQVGDVIFAEWFVDGEKLGEHRYVWDNPDWSTGVHANEIDNQAESNSPLPVGNYEIVVFVNEQPKQCKAFTISDDDNSNESEQVAGCAMFEEAVVASSPGSWDRYEARTLGELDVLTAELLSDLEEGNIYLETASEYQFPSRVQAVYTGQFRDTSETSLLAITALMATFAPNLTADEVAELFAREMLVTEGDEAYWLLVQSVLIPIMEEELLPGDDMELLVLWVGAYMKDGELVRIYSVNAFE